MTLLFSCHRGTRTEMNLNPKKVWSLGKAKVLTNVLTCDRPMHFLNPLLFWIPCIWDVLFGKAPLKVYPSLLLYLSQKHKNYYFYCTEYLHSSIKVIHIILFDKNLYCQPHILRVNGLNINFDKNYLTYGMMKLHYKFLQRS